VLASWQPNYKFGDRLYSYGLAQYEYDPVQGYDGRYTLGGGLGYAVLRSEAAKLDFEGGPTLRHLDPVDAAAHTGLAARASLNLALKLSPTLEVKQTSAFYYERGDTSGSALTTLDARLFGPLKARFSYDLRYETGASARAEQLNTVSRATLVYSF
jgi:putative salt-induced outer membrane protein